MQCKLFIPERLKPNKSLYGRYEDCNAWSPDDCMCECYFCEILAKDINGGPAQLGKHYLRCPALAFKTILDVGLEFIPRGQAPGAIEVVV